MRSNKRSAWHGGTVHLLHVYEPQWRLWTSARELPALGEFESAHRALLEGNLRQFAGVPAEREPILPVYAGKKPGHRIAEYCRSAEADLVILGAQGTRNLSYVMLGSTVERLLKQIPCSVLVVRSAVGAYLSNGRTP